MSHLADTSVIARRVLPNDPNHTLVKRAIAAIKRSGGMIYVTPQVMIEFRAVATRPLASNGFGMTAAQADAEARKIMRLFPMLPDTDTIYRRWQKLVRSYGVTGLRVHDTRLVAVMITHNIPNILTLNPKDFRQFTEINVVEPQSLVNP